MQDMEHSKERGTVIIFCRHVTIQRSQGEASFSLEGASERSETMDEYCEKN